MFRLENLADQMNVITSVVQSWTRCLKNTRTYFLPFDCPAQFYACHFSIKISAPLQMYAWCQRMGTQFTHKGQVWAHFSPPFWLTPPIFCLLSEIIVALPQGAAFTSFPIGLHPDLLLPLLPRHHLPPLLLLSHPLPHFTSCNWESIFVSEVNVMINIPRGKCPDFP